MADSRSQPPAAAIFDLDGTLIDSLSDIAAATNRMLVAQGLPAHPPERFPGFIGEGARRLVEQALAEAGGEAHTGAIDAGLARFREEYGQALVVETAPYAGVDALLQALARAAVPMAVLSNKPDTWTRRIVAQLFPEVPFVGVRGQRPEVPRKPDPTAALALADRLRAEPDRIALIGDSPVDVATARAAGMRAWVVDWGFASAEQLAKAAPDRCFSSVDALARALLPA